MDSDEAVDRAKRGLRASLLAARMTRNPDELDAARASIRQAVVARVRAEGWQRIAAYEPLRTEPGSLELLTELQALGILVLVPVTLADRDLDWRVWKPAEPSAKLDVSSSEIEGPIGRQVIGTVDAIFVPALAVDRTGNRLGRGGGSYDRALTRGANGVVMAALIFDDELVDVLPSAPWDIAVTAVVRPSGWSEL